MIWLVALAICLSSIELKGEDGGAQNGMSWLKFHHWRNTPLAYEIQQPLILNEHIVQGRILLSMQSYLELVLRNDTEISLSRLRVTLQKTSIMRAFAPFDPSFGISLSRTRAIQPTATALLGAATLQSEANPLNFTLQQLLSSGASLVTSFDASRYADNSTFTRYNPALSSRLGLQVDQPLMRNRGASLIKRTILIAKRNHQISQEQFEQQLNELVARNENLYWDLVEARANVRLRQSQLAIQEAALKRAQQQVEADSLLPVELYQPKTQYAAAQLALIQSKLQMARAEHAVRRRIGADLDPATRNLPIELTEPIAEVAIQFIDRELAVSTALVFRGDRRAALSAISLSDLSLANATEDLRPSVSLTGSYFLQGLNGLFLVRNSLGATPTIRIPGGFGNALRQMFSLEAPTYSVGLRVSLPLRNSASSADQAEAIIKRRLNVLQLRSMEQTIREQVLKAIDDLEAARASLDQALIARDFGIRRFETEQKRYELGATQLFFLLDAQTQMSLAESEVVRQRILCRRGQVALSQATGTILSDRGIAIYEKP